jgi:hypothetical protein
MNKSDMIERLIEYYSDGIKAKFAQKLGLKPQTINGWIIRNTFDAELIFSKCEGVSSEWLLTGRGDMLRDAGSHISHVRSVGVPYYDVDFLGGFDSIYNDNTTVPMHNIVSVVCPRAEMWCNITGHSMEPTISNGDIIALRKCSVEDVQYGEIYAVVLDGLRTVKVIRKSKTKGMLLFVPVNKDGYDEQEFAINRITQIYEVLGCIKRFF